MGTIVLVIESIALVIALGYIASLRSDVSYYKDEVEHQKRLRLIAESFLLR